MAKTIKKLSDEDIIELLKDQQDSASQLQEELSIERERLQGVYRAKKYGNEVDGWSQSVHPTAWSAVEWMKPGLVEIFVGDFFNLTPVMTGKDSIQQVQQMMGQMPPNGPPGGMPAPPQMGQPQGGAVPTMPMQPGMGPPQGMPGGQGGQNQPPMPPFMPDIKDPRQEAAKRMKNYIRFKMFAQQEGEQFIDDIIHDSLVNHYGIAKVYYKDDYDLRVDKYNDLTQEEYDAVVVEQDPGEKSTITDVSHDDPVEEKDEVTGLPVMKYNNVKIVRRVEKYKGFYVENIPAYELYFIPGYKDLESCPFVAHVVKRDLDYIKRKELAGEYRKGTTEKIQEKINTRPTITETDSERRSMYEVDGISAPDSGMDLTSAAKERLASNEVLIWEIYTKLDLDGDGLLQPVIVTLCEDVVLSDPIENPYGSPPFELCYILREPHKIMGRGIPSILEDRQKVLSNLLRFVQDSAARSAYGGYLTSDHQAKRALAGAGPGEAIWVPDISRVKELNPGNPSNFIFNAMETTLTEVAKEIGVNENMQGLDNNALNKTASGMQMRLTAGMQRQKLYARRVARTFKRILRRILDIIRLYPPDDDVRAIGDDVNISSDDLMGYYSVDIEVGVGPQDRQQQAQLMNQLVMFQTQVALQAGMCSPQQVVEAIIAQYSYMDMDVSSYFFSGDVMKFVQGLQQQVQQSQMQIQGMGQQMQGMGQQMQQLQQQNMELKNKPQNNPAIEEAKMQLEERKANHKMALEEKKLEMQREIKMLEFQMKQREQAMNQIVAAMNKESDDSREDMRFDREVQMRDKQDRDKAAKDEEMRAAKEAEKADKEKAAQHSSQPQVIVVPMPSGGQRQIQLARDETGRISGATVHEG